jgi:hypothetical protein
MYRDVVGLGPSLRRRSLVGPQIIEFNERSSAKQIEEEAIIRTHAAASQGTNTRRSIAGCGHSLMLLEKTFRGYSLESQGPQVNLLRQIHTGADPRSTHMR